MWTPPKASAYGGILLTRGGRILLREPTHHYDGYVWTFAKGRPEKDDSPEETALREVREETGYDAEIVDVLPGIFKGGTTTNAFFVMRHIGPPGRFDERETASVRWMDFSVAEKLIVRTTNPVGRSRDLAILIAAKAWFDGNRSVVLPDDEYPRFSVRRYDFNSLDFPAAYDELSLDMFFCSDEARSIRMGYLPTDPEHSWIHWFEGTVLNMHRRGTGICLYRIHFEAEGHGLRAVRAQANRDRTECSGLSGEEERSLVKLQLLELART
ncbi:MAG: NUDIX hydrolase [Moraxellaceae bacterium]|nr:NUDIX hydrolase [Moraxellaceae bacterium]